jgi:hypothetical protein
MIIELSKEFPALIFLFIQFLCVTTPQGELLSSQQSQDTTVGQAVKPFTFVKPYYYNAPDLNYWCNLARTEPQGEIPSNPYSTTTTTTTSSASVAGTASMISGTITTTTTTL